MFEKKESILEILLNLSQLQFPETDSLGLDEIIKKKDTCFKELKQLDKLLEKWYSHYEDIPLKKIEQNLEKNIKDLMEKILISEKDFEKILEQGKKDVSKQITQISRQMEYIKTPDRQRLKIKNMKT